MIQLFKETTGRTLRNIKRLSKRAMEEVRDDIEEVSSPSIEKEKGGSELWTLEIGARSVILHLVCVTVEYNESRCGR